MFGTSLSVGMPARSIAAFAFAIAAVNATVWLAAIVPALLSSDPASLMKGTGLLTNPVYVQDLAIWLPLLMAAALACWHRRAWGLLVTAAMLVMLTLEGIGVATDQWFGSRADPTSPAASMTMVPAFAALALVIGTVLAVYLHTSTHPARAPRWAVHRECPTGGWGMRIVVACATRHGSTAEIAAEIADVLRRNVSGAVVDLRDAAKAGEMAAYDAAVIGSAVYMGRWLPAARDLVQGHREVLSAMPVWLFSSGPLGDPSVPVDELAEVTALGVAIGARGHRLFAGRLDRQELRWVERAAARMVHAPEGDFRDHDEIRRWASGVASALTTGEAARR